MRTKGAFLMASLVRRPPLVSNHRRISLSSPINPDGNSSNNDDDNNYFDDDDDEADVFLIQQLARMEAMEEITDLTDDFLFDDDDDFADLFDIGDDTEGDDDVLPGGAFENVPAQPSARNLERALMQGVVPAGAGVGNEFLPGDWGFDPLNLSTKDYIGSAQRAVWAVVGMGLQEDEEEISLETTTTANEVSESGRPTALIMRDYREAEIRHGRLAMLASLFWPLQEMFDRLLLDESQFGSLVYSSGVTLPFIPLLMTAIMLLLGYLDVYSQSVRAVDKIGEAFLPGDCFWDPLSILEGAPATMKRNMQERELFNGRMAMLATAVYFWEEFKTHQPLISIEGNELLFEPAYTVPFIQKWLDAQFSPVFPMTLEDAASLADDISSLNLLE
ncbi:chlorophyll A-B binding protein [Fragilaria crotonensis]|nr:chlorophyll A-B binding protein [Fragilaria crotonensis]